MKKIKIALIGNPNVGKSTLFYNITHKDVIVSNYPGTTVEIFYGQVKYKKYYITVIDLPGIYSLDPTSEDSKVACRSIIEEKPDVIINVIDSTKLERNLYLTLQIIELGIPVILVLNMYDEVIKKGIKIDYKNLSEKLGVVVIPFVASKAENASLLLEKAVEIARKKQRIKTIRMSEDLEFVINSLKKDIQKIKEIKRINIPAKTIAIRLLEGDTLMYEILSSLPKSETIFKNTENLIKKIKDSNKEPIAIRIARERHINAENIFREVTKFGYEKRDIKQKIDKILLQNKTGIPIMISVYIFLILSLVYIGGFLESLILNFYSSKIYPLLNYIFSNLFVENNIARIFDIGINFGLQGILAVMIPYIFVFFFILAILEDIGYLPRLAYIMDSFMHKIGLNGKAVVPMLGGFGCNVPAIMATRTLATRRERIISSILITIIPCSARTAVILGMVGYYLGVKYAFFTYGIVILLIAILGIFLNIILPGSATGMIYELPPLRIPSLKPILIKTWIRMKDFVFIATPILILGSFIIGFLEVYNVLQPLSEYASPIVVGILGLPSLAFIPLVYGFIRKEGALVLLFSVFGTSNIEDFMSPLQIFVFSLVVAIYIPCLATVAVLKREFGWKDAYIIVLINILLAIFVGWFLSKFNPFGL